VQAEDAELFNLRVTVLADRPDAGRWLGEVRQTLHRTSGEITAAVQGTEDFLSREPHLHTDFGRTPERLSYKFDQRDPTQDYSFARGGCEESLPVQSIRATTW